MTTNCPDCGQPLKPSFEATCGLDQDCRVWPMMACLSCLDRGARGYWGRRSDGATIPVRPLHYESRSPGPRRDMHRDIHRLSVLSPSAGSLTVDRSVQ
jgi:hypothetical protein